MGIKFWEPIEEEQIYRYVKYGKKLLRKSQAMTRSPQEKVVYLQSIFSHLNDIANIQQIRNVDLSIPATYK